MKPSDPIVDLEARSFGRRSLEALANDSLRGALDKVTTEFAKRREQALAQAPDWEIWREQARAIKAHTLASLDTYLAQFMERAEARGIHVHVAQDREEACALVWEIVQQAQASNVVKGKSMVTEEIGLNEYLLSQGIAPVETDLGEWIIQLAGEKPSHIIAPAIHRTREEVGHLFHTELGVPESHDVEELTAVARRFLRTRFAEAEVGVSGVNFLVAETGSFLILENEGNVRLCTSLPKVHIAVTGIEKVIPRLADLDVFLSLLPRSATGQAMTTYQTLFTGPKPDPGDEGPEAIHLVLLDNGRSNQLSTPLEREALACIRCGACLNVCPVYKQVGGHTYGSVYPGPIGAVITPALAGQDRAGNLPHASSLCGACRDVCPVKINLPELLLDLREKGKEAGLSERWGFAVWSRIASRPRLSSVLGRGLTRALGLAQSSGLFARCVGRLTATLFPPLKAWQRGRELPPMPARSFRQLWKAGLDAEEPPA
jgi:L-lactate dehydrogenase complex protein LldF